MSQSRLRAANEASDKIKVHTFEVYKMTHALMSAVAKAGDAQRRKISAYAFIVKS